MSILDVFSYPPLLRGLIAMIAAGIAFPLIGVFILRLHLIQLKFTLMHGAFLGGAIAMAAGADPLLIGLGVNLLLVFSLAPLARAARLNQGAVSGLFMVLTIAAAFIIVYKLGLPAKDVFSLLWGNIFALGAVDLAVTLGWVLLVTLLIVLCFKPITAVLFDREIAHSTGLDEKLVSNLISAAAGITVTLALKLLGALLLDSVLILPALAALLLARSARGLFLTASLLGLLFSITGFFTAIAIDIPASSGVTIAGAAGFLVCFAYSKLKLIVRRRTDAGERKGT